MSRIFSLLAFVSPSLAISSPPLSASLFVVPPSKAVTRQWSPITRSLLVYPAPRSLRPNLQRKRAVCMGLFGLGAPEIVVIFAVGKARTFALVMSNRVWPHLPWILLVDSRVRPGPRKTGCDGQRCRPGIDTSLILYIPCVNGPCRHHWAAACSGPWRNAGSAQGIQRRVSTRVDFGRDQRARAQLGQDRRDRQGHCWGSGGRI